jgi:uncharacterized repeat protein (TIGR03803 family)
MLLTSAPSYGNHRLLKSSVLVFILCFLAVSAARADHFSTLWVFNYTDGSLPGPLVQGRDGAFYGTTSEGPNTVFRVNPDGVLIPLHKFDQSDGYGPTGRLTLGTDGDFYGTASWGGANGEGTVFKITRLGRFTKLYDFCRQPNCADGSNPSGGLIEASDGDFYGVTTGGGINCSEYFGGGCGTLFKISSNGTLTTLYRFSGVDGIRPWAPPVQASNDLLYGTTGSGGDLSCIPPYGCGTVFSMAPDGALTTLHNFSDQDGDQPLNPLIEGVDGNLYGTTAAGGAFNWGTLFRITTDGNLTTLYSFDESAGEPGGLIQASDGALYGSTSTEYGADFRASWNGGIGFLHGTQYQWAIGEPLQATTGAFYGPSGPGDDDWPCNPCGTIVKFDTGLGPFVSLDRYAGRVDETTGILGQAFTDASWVTFNGHPAQFQIISDTFIEATVPDGATTGYVKVAKPTGSLTSNRPFRVMP